MIGIFISNTLLQLKKFSSLTNFMVTLETKRFNKKIIDFNIVSISNTANPSIEIIESFNEDDLAFMKEYIFIRQSLKHYE